MMQQATTGVRSALARGMTVNAVSEHGPNVEVTGVVQHAAWHQRVIPPVERLASDLWSIPVPIPNNPLRYVSIYALGSQSSLTLIDAGWNSDDSWAALCTGLSHLHASISDVTACLVTHQHFDHVGLAHRVREASGAWVGMHPADRDALCRPEFRDPELALSAEVDWLIRLGASRDEAVRLRGDPLLYERRRSIAIPDRLIVDGQDLSVSGRTLRAVHTPGHTPGHLCFVDHRTRLLFAGDHVLPRISPNIAAHHDSDADALGRFLASLDMIASYGIDEVLPAHEWRFRGLRTRVQQLHEHHERRLKELLDVVGRHPGSVPWEIAGELTWSRPWHDYDGYMRISAVGETVAHLVRLMRVGLVTATADAVPRYMLARSKG